jgi:hypothetical protein
MTTVRAWTEAIINENDPKCDLFRVVTDKWPHVKITDLDHNDDTIYYNGGPMGYALSLLRPIMDQTGCSENDVISVITKPYDGRFAIAFTEDLHAFQFKLLAEPASHMRVDYYGW